MFGFGLGKLLLLAIVVAAVWYAFKTVGGQGQRRPGKVREKRKQTADSIDKMDKCPVCGTYVVADRAANCGRKGCPY